MIDSERHQAKQVIQPLRAALYNFDRAALSRAVQSQFTRQAVIQLAHPFETLDGPEALLEQAWLPLQAALPDLERRDLIVMAGPDQDGQQWLGCCGYYTGCFAYDFLEIPATGHQASLRYHEFFRVVDGKIAELQALWDIPELMLQAGCWPMVPSLGREWHVPGPSTQDGLAIVNDSEQHAQRSLQLVGDMVAGLSRFATGGVAAMGLEKYWHPHCSWYGPAGIGTCRGISGFRNWHQIPFLNAIPDRLGSGGHMFADGDYVGFTAWPKAMDATVTGDGWLGIAPAGQRITLRSFDFWRCENGLLRENWVLIDLLDVYHQLGVNVLERMRELNKPLAVAQALWREKHQ